MCFAAPWHGRGAGACLFNDRRAVDAELKEGTDIMKMRTTAALAAMAAGFTISSASAQVFRGVSGSTTTLHGGDRELKTLSFTGATNAMTGIDFARFTDASMTTFITGNTAGPFGWNSAMPRDMSTAGNRISGNPDRADNSTPYLGEGSNSGTLAEVFGTSRLGYKNMSWIIDGEEADGVEKYTLDLFFAPGVTLSGDASGKTVELALLERGNNSDIRIYGITAARSLTSALFVPREALTPAGWSLDTLEIDSAQTVAGVGISISKDWKNLVGIRIEQDTCFNGTDIVGVGVTNVVPAPGPMMLGALGGVILLRRRR